MPIAPEFAAPSTLDVVLGQVGDLMRGAGDATPIEIGKQYLRDFGIGSPPRVLFVPEPRGQIGPPLELGNAASLRHSCNLYVRAAEPGDDLGRFSPAYALAKRIVTAIRRAATGRLDFADFRDASPTDVDAYGADLLGEFTYTCDVPHDAEIMAVGAAAADTSTQRPLIPPGVPGTEPTAFDPTVAPQNGGG